MITFVSIEENISKIAWSQRFYKISLKFFSKKERTYSMQLKTAIVDLLKIIVFAGLSIVGVMVGTVVIFSLFLCKIFCHALIIWKQQHEFLPMQDFKDVISQAGETVIRVIMSMGWPDFMAEMLRLTIVILMVDEIDTLSSTFLFLFRLVVI